MQRTMNYRRFFWRVGLILAVFLALYLVLNGQLQEVQQKEKSLQVTLSRLEETNQDLETELRQVDSEDYIVSSAMTNYAFMNKNDIRFSYTNPEALYAYTEEELKILMEEMAE